MNLESRKVFRMKYEPCLGTCYCYDDLYREELTKEILSNKSVLNQLLNDLDYIHEKTCGNSAYGYAIDYHKNKFIGTIFYDAQSQSFIENDIVSIIKEFKMLSSKLIPDNKAHKTDCDHGRDDNIKEFTLKILNVAHSG